MMRWQSRPARLRIALVCILCCLSAACAKRPPVTDVAGRARYNEARDPLEPMNRAIFKFNNGFYHYVLDPLTDGYEFIVPRPARDAFRNFLRNLGSPIRLINDVLQGEPKQAGVTIGRFVANSTIGIGGLFDPAQKMGLKYHDEDFGQTLAIWGANEGAYLVLPIIGPYSVRDSFGFLGDILMDPVTWVLKGENLNYLNWARTGSDGLVTYTQVRGDLKSVQEGSLDPYAAVRSLQRQRRDYAIKNGDLHPDAAPTPNDPFSSDFQDFPDEDSTDFPDYEDGNGNGNGNGK